MKKAPLILTHTLFIVAFTVNAQVTNEITVFVGANTPVKVVGDFANSGTGNFTVSPNAILDIDGDLNNNGIMTFENDASLLRGSNSVDGGSGTYNVKRQGSTGNLTNLWGSPVGTSGFVPGSPSYSYTEATSTQWDGDDSPSDPGWNTYNGNMTPGNGYAGTGAGLVTFSDDQVMNGIISTPLHVATYDNTLTSTTGGTPFNLVGNPYPSALDAWSLVNDINNSNIHGSLYFWDDDGSGGTDFAYDDYATWNASGGLPAVVSPGGGLNVPNGIIPTAQGFMVRNETATQLTFKNSMRVANNSSNHFFRMDGTISRLWFSVNSPAVFNQILITLNEDATDGEDRLYDAVKARGNQNVSLTAYDNGNDYAIMAFPPPSVDKTIPLSLFISTVGNHSFKADIMEGFSDFDVYFNDVLNSISVLLEEGTEIPVNLAAGDYENRFFLNFVRTSFTGIEDTEESSLTAYAANGLLYVGCTGCQPDATIQLIDMSGRVVLSETNPNFDGGMSVTDISALSTGIYVVRVTTDNQVLSQKIINQ